MYYLYYSFKYFDILSDVTPSPANKKQITSEPVTCLSLKSKLFCSKIVSRRIISTNSYCTRKYNEKKGKSPTVMIEFHSEWPTSIRDILSTDQARCDDLVCHILTWAEHVFFVAAIISACPSSKSVHIPYLPNTQRLAIEVRQNYTFGGPKTILSFVGGRVTRDNMLNISPCECELERSDYISCYL